MIEMFLLELKLFINTIGNKQIKKVEKKKLKEIRSIIKEDIIIIKKFL